MKNKDLEIHFKTCLSDPLLKTSAVSLYLYYGPPKWSKSITTYKIMGTVPLCCCSTCWHVKSLQSVVLPWPANFENYFRPNPKKDIAVAVSKHQAQ